MIDSDPQIFCTGYFINVTTIDLYSESIGECILVITRCSHLLTLNVMNQSDAHLDKLSRSFCIVVMYLCYYI